MPELPEVEVVRRFLKANIFEKAIIDVNVFWDKSFIGSKKDILNRKIISFSRLGKQLSIGLDNGLIILFHLKMTGQLVYQNGVKTTLGHPTPNTSQLLLPHKSTRLEFVFSDGSKLYFNDQRKFGWVRVMTSDQLREFQQNLGVDAVSKKFTVDYFEKELKTSRRPIKTVLLDQNKFAGIGNIYANDALYLAGIHPQTPAADIPKNQVKLLHQSVIDLLNESIGHGGSTAKDNKYIRPDGSFGQHQYYFRVYQKERETCLNCGSTIERLKMGGRSSFFCPKCQPKKFG